MPGKGTASVILPGAPPEYDSRNEQATRRELTNVITKLASQLREYNVLPTFSDSTRPDASTKPAGFAIWNTDDNQPNYSDGTSWRTADGTTT